MKASCEAPNVTICPARSSIWTANRSLTLPIPHPVKAWVHYGKIPIQVDAVEAAWITPAVAIKWETPDGEHEAWVWPCAIIQRP
jgi:hypothetical protein